MKKVILGLSLATASLLASDQLIKEHAVGVKVGTLGIGVEYTGEINNKFDLRLGLNKYDYSHSAAESEIDYDIELNLETFALIADYHPFDNSFTLSAGAFINNNSIDLNAKPTGGNYEIDGTTYTAAQVGSLNAKVEFNDVSPYIGFGYNGATKATGLGWSFSAEIGALYQGDPDVKLTTTSTVAAVVTSVAEEQKQLNEEIDGFEWYPVISFGVSYKF